VILERVLNIQTRFSLITFGLRHFAHSADEMIKDMILSSIQGLLANGGDTDYSTSSVTIIRHQLTE